MSLKIVTYCYTVSYVQLGTDTKVHVCPCHMSHQLDIEPFFLP